MLFELMKFLAHYYDFFQVFNYITLRGILSALTALAIAWIGGPIVIRLLARRNINEKISTDGPETHGTKSGTPTMGGSFLLGALLISMFLWADLMNTYIMVLFATIILFGALGFVDDCLKLLRQSGKGLRAKTKFIYQIIFATAVAWALYSIAAVPEATTLIVPFFKNVAIPLGIGFVFWTMVVIIGSSNAVNLTDGLDGLAIVPVAMIGSALGVIAYLTGHAVFANYLYIPYIPGSGELVVFCASLAGASLGFLWYNTHPAEIFMGDTGSLPLGAALAVLAVISRHEIVFFLMSGILVAEAISVMAQVFFYRWKRFRVFKMAPLHHHYEILGLKEPKIVVRFWIITMVLVLAGLATLKLR